MSFKQHQRVRSKTTSVLSIGFSILAFAMFSYAGMRREDSTALSRVLSDQDQSWRWIVILGAAFVLLRIVCSSLSNDSKKPATSSDLYRDVSDRIADVFVIMGCALIAEGPYRLDLGWFCAVIAVATAYVRTLGGAVGAKQRPLGPMAKRHRMAALAFGCVLLAVFPGIVRGHNVMDAVLFIVAVGGAFTCWRRLMWIAKDLQEAKGTES